MPGRALSLPPTTMASPVSLLVLLVLLVPVHGVLVGPKPPPVRIGLYVGNGTSRSIHNGTSAMDLFYSTLAEGAGMAFPERLFTIDNLTEPDIGALSAADYEAVVFPGGSGGGQARAIGEEGLVALRQFVGAGRGYIGTCGGAFLGIQHVQVKYGSG